MDGALVLVIEVRCLLTLRPLAAGVEALAVGEAVAVGELAAPGIAALLEWHGRRSAAGRDRGYAG